MAIRFGYKMARCCGNCKNMKLMGIESEIVIHLATGKPDEYDIYEACMIDDHFVPVDSDHVCQLHETDEEDQVDCDCNEVDKHPDCDCNKAEDCTDECRAEVDPETVVRALLPKQLMSGGIEATLENYLTRAKLFFGDDSKAVGWLKLEINAHGKDAIVESPEADMVSIMFDFHTKGETNGRCEITSA